MTNSPAAATVPTTYEDWQAAYRLTSEHGAPFKSIDGTPPDLHSVPPGCVFQSRCPLVRDICRAERPPLVEVAEGRQSACHFWDEV